MKEILFRGKRVDNGEWVYGLPRFAKYFPEVEISAIEDENGNVYEDVNPETIYQFTGLLDKNGNKIFIGDRVKDDYGRIMEIVFWNYRYCFYAITETNFKVADFFDWLPTTDLFQNSFPIKKLEVEIIGNIHEEK